MELRELGDRLFRLHAKLIIAVLVFGVLAGLALSLHDKPQYQANVTLVIGAQDPQSAQEAAVLADTARGIATGPQLVARAIARSGAARSETQVAAGTNVQTLGSSGVLTLSVTDPDPRVAMRLADALANEVVATRRTLIQNGLASSLRGLTSQEALIDTQIKKLNTRIQALAAQVGRTSSSSSGVLVAQLDVLQARLTALQDQATQIAVQRNNLEAQQGPEAAVLDKAVSAVRLPRRTLDDTLLGGLLGLALGVAIAATQEMMRPSLFGAPAIARAVGGPLLGEMSTPPDSWTLAALPDSGTYIELAADAQHVQEVRFAVLDPGGRGRGRAQVRMLKGQLQQLRFGQQRAAEPSAGGSHDGPSAAPATGARGSAPTVSSPENEGSRRTGLVVAVPRVLKVADLEAVTSFMWISGWTLLGVIGYCPQRKEIGRARRDPGETSLGPREASGAAPDRATGVTPNDPDQVARDTGAGAGGNGEIRPRQGSEVSARRNGAGSKRRDAAAARHMEADI
jgi:capsular polysaccharide biosynthesis protein